MQDKPKNKPFSQIAAQHLPDILVRLGNGEDLKKIAASLELDRSALSRYISDKTGKAPVEFKPPKNQAKIKLAVKRLKGGEDLNAIAKDMGLKPAALHMAFTRAGKNVSAIKHPYSLDQAIAKLEEDEGIQLPLHFEKHPKDRRRIALRLVLEFKVRLEDAGGAVGVSKQAVSLWIKASEPNKGKM